ncbi:hypothetical protein SLS58_001591 [Diplodia intermedia]|uniref:Uncharacterized protein n=1 Tax=Diplodia intermedia TaxID=856260 RepID=A0ABR3U1J9_9PEZI
MQGSSPAPSIVSLSDSSADEADRRLPQHDSDDEILKADFLDGITYKIEDSPDSSSISGDDNIAANSGPMRQESEDDPNSQLLREAETGQSPRSNRKRTDEEQAALLNSTLFAHGRGPAPLPSRPERRAASRDGRHSTTSTPRRNKEPARPGVYELPADSPAPNPTSPSAPHEVHHEEGESNARQLRPSTRSQKQPKPKESEAVQPAATPASEEPKKRKPGRPRKKTATAAEIIAKRQKTDSANTGRRRSKAGEAEGSEDVYKSTERRTSMATSPSSSKASKSAPKKAQTATEKLSRMHTKKTSAQEDPIDEQTSDASERLFVTTSTTESHTRDEESNDLDGLGHLQEALRNIWTNEEGVKKVREKREENGLQEKNNSTKTVIGVCRGLQDELKDFMKLSAAPDETESTRVSRTIRNLARTLNEFDLANEKEINNHLFQDLYAFIFPCLLRTLCNIVDYYMRVLKRDAAPDTIPTSQLAELTGFTAAIIDLDERAKASPVQVPTQLVIVKPTRNCIIAPLKRLRRLLVQLVARQSNPRHMVYFKIIKKHCGPGGALRPFSVSEIVQKSQYFKRMLEDREWTRLIPTF